MRGFGKALFSGSRFIRWTIIPCAIASGILLLVPAEGSKLSGVWTIGTLEACLVLLVLAVGWPVKFHWAGRVLGIAVFVACVAAIVADVRKHSGGVPWTDKEVWQDTRMMFLAAIPSLWYAVRGRFGIGHPKSEQV